MFLQEGLVFPKSRVLQYLNAFIDEWEKFGDWQKGLVGSELFLEMSFCSCKDSLYKTNIVAFNSSNNWVAT